MANTNTNTTASIVALLTTTAIEAMRDGVSFDKAFGSVVGDLREQFREEYISELSGALSDKPKASKAKPSTGAKRGPKPGSTKRTPEELHALKASIIEVVGQHAGEAGVAMGVVLAQLEVEASAVAAPVRQLVEGGQLVRQGEKRAAVYWVGDKPLPELSAPEAVVEVETPVEEPAAEPEPAVEPVAEKKEEKKKPRRSGKKKTTKAA